MAPSVRPSALLLGALALAGCSADAATRLPPVAADPSPAPVGPAQMPSPSPSALPPEPVDVADDLDGDGREDAYLLQRSGGGWSFDVTLADGRMASALLPAGLAVAEDVAVVAAADLDADGRDEVLVRTLRAAAGEGVVVFRLVDDRVVLLRTADGAAWELSTAGGMSGPRSYDCVPQAGSGRVVRTREALREGSADAPPTYSATTRTWALAEAEVALLTSGTRHGLGPEQVQLDPASCRR